VLRHRAENRGRQEQQCAHQQDRAEQDETKRSCRCIVPAVNGVGFLAARLRDRQRT
jgi:hypothetical protein